MLHTKGHHDFGSANYMQALLEEVLAGDGLERQLQIIRPAYARKMQTLHETLVGEGLRDAGWRWTEPTGGLYLWLEAPATLDTGMESAFCHRCIADGVLYVPGELCFGDDTPRHFVRLSYGVLAGRELAEAGRRFVRVAQAVAR
jgi:2-aminoadipate transaminase